MGFLNSRLLCLLLGMTQLASYLYNLFIDLSNELVRTGKYKADEFI